MKGNYCKPNNCKPNNCKMVLKKYHELIKESDCLYKKADNLIDKIVIDSICSALNALGDAIELTKAADYKRVCANAFLRKSGCDKMCNKDCKKCKELYNEMKKSFMCEREAQCRTMDLLEEALECIKKSIEARNEGKCAEKKYNECIHENCCNHKPGPKPGPKPEHDMKPCYDKQYGARDYGRGNYGREDYEEEEFNDHLENYDSDSNCDFDKDSCY